MNINTDCHLLPMEGAYNIRDLGGYPAENGGVTRKGLFFRADNTANLTPKDVDLLREKGVSLSIDLRSPKETQDWPSKLKGCAGMRYENIVMLDEISSNGFRGNFPASMAEMYIRNLDGARDSFVQVFRLLIENSGAALFHCTAGKDRTGMVSMLLLELAGAPDEVIVADYAATERYMQPVFAKLVEQMKGIGVDVPDHALRSEPDSMRRLLAHLRAKYGSARHHLEAGGIAPAELSALIARFVEY